MISLELDLALYCIRIRKGSIKETINDFLNRIEGDTKNQKEGETRSPKRGVRKGVVRQRRVTKRASESDSETVPSTPIDAVQKQSIQSVHKTPTSITSREQRAIRRRKNYQSVPHTSKLPLIIKNLPVDLNSCTKFLNYTSQLKIDEFSEFAKSYRSLLYHKSTREYFETTVAKLTKVFLDGDYNDIPLIKLRYLFRKLDEFPLNVMEGKKSKYLMTITLNNIKSMNYKLWGYCDSNLLFEVFQAISITVKKILMCWILDNKGILYVQDPTRDPNMLKVIQSTLKGTLNHSFAGLEYGLKGSRANDNHIIRSIGSLGGGQSLLLMKHYLELLSKLSVKISQDFPDDIDDTRLSVLSHLIVLNYSELTSTYLKLKWF